MELEEYTLLPCLFLNLSHLPEVTVGGGEENIPVHRVPAQQSHVDVHAHA